MACHRGRGQKARELPGAWLAFLAVAIQALLPFLVAFEIAIAFNPAYANDFPICHAPGSSSTAPANHANGDSCPICAAMAVGQAFTTPPPVAAPLPQSVRYVVFDIATPVQGGALACTPYQSRAPPSST